jgi:sarcosine oxidase subunit alpha
VTLANVTGQYAAMNLAGPESRRILSTLTKCDLTPEAFPYLGAREEDVRGVPARLMRVGFVGELGYEIHVPTAQAEWVWRGLMQAGQSAGLRPFGVEAQRILRLEKGHVIVSQDTDGLTTPSEANMGWAVQMNKPFFVGQRSLKILQKRPFTRGMVGFTLGPSDRDAGVKECHLIIENGEIVGRTTSVAFSPTLKRVIGLAYLPPDRTAPGTSFSIRIDSGAVITATVVATPFYDPQNTRQS